MMPGLAIYSACCHVHLISNRVSTILDAKSNMRCVICFSSIHIFYIGF